MWQKLFEATHAVDIAIFAQDSNWVVKMANLPFPKHYPTRQIALDAARKIGRETGARIVLYERDKATPVIYAPGTY